MKRFLVTLFLYCITLSVFAENTILIVGDSLSAGYGMELKDSWVALLQTHLKKENYPYRVINASITGDTTSDGLARLPQILKQYHPHITIIELGNNDGLRGIQIPVIKNNLQQIIALTKKAKSKVMVLGTRLPPNYGATYTQQFQQIFLELAKRKDILVVPLFLKNVDQNPKLIQADGAHPKAQAQPMLFNTIWPTLKKLL